MRAVKEQELSGAVGANGRSYKTRRDGGEARGQQGIKGR